MYLLIKGVFKQTVQERHSIGIVLCIVDWPQRQLEIFPLVAGLLPHTNNMIGLDYV